MCPSGRAVYEPLTSEFTYDDPIGGGNLSSGAGNVTDEWRWDSTKGGYSAPMVTGATQGNLSASNAIHIRRSFLQGDLLTETDPNTNQRVYQYNGGITNPYPTNLTEASRSTLARDWTFTWDVKSGRLTSETDTNNSNTTINADYDPRGREQDRYLTGFWKTSTSYDDSSSTAAANEDLDSPDGGKTFRTVQTVKYTDDLGRVWKTVTSDETCKGGIQVVSLEQTSGNYNYKLVSNPFCNTTDATMGWTLTQSDPLGRTTAVQHFNGGTPPAPWGSNPNSSGTATTTYDANQYTVMDEAGVTRTMTMNALNQLQSVEEAGTTTTTYAYDSLDHLLSVNQGGLTTSGCTNQFRCFAYTSLGRLQTATNPESGTIQYEYDNNGNLTKRTDGRGIITTWMPYDALNRPTGKSYSDGTPSVTYCYDGQTYGGSTGVCTGTRAPYFYGRLSQTYTSDSKTTINSYDAAGRVLASTQTTGGVDYSFPSYQYNMLDGLTSEQYPSGRTIQYTYDNGGRVNTVAGSLNSTTTPYAGTMMNPIKYTSHHAFDTVPLGNGVTESWSYNARLQTTGVQAGSLMSLTFGYSDTQNNGNVISQTITRGNQSWAQSYGYYEYNPSTQQYSQYNRLSCVNEVYSSNGPATPVPCGNGGVSWTEKYAYDANGNIAVTPDPELPSVSVETPQSLSWYNSQNQIASWYYDCAGNVTGIPASATGTPSCTDAPTGSMLRTASYDAENRMKTDTTAGGATTSYTYDGDGRRVMKTTGGTMTTYVYDAPGQLIAEYGGTLTDSGTEYLTPDGLGSTRLVTNAPGASGATNATCTHAYDYLPFGGDLYAGTDSRSTCYDSVPGAGILFTGKERDAETGLDFFEARYFSAAQGRFTSPDLPVDQHPQDPQSWNLYSYVRNNPLSLTDPTGNYACGTYTTESQCTAFGNMLAQTQSTLDKARQAGTIDSDQYKSASAAVAAYGTLNDGNGVTVNVGATGGFPGNTIAEGGGEKTAANPTGQNIQVTLNGKLFDQAMSSSSGSSTAMLGVIAHEGSHVRDAEVWATAGFTPGANPTNLRTEFAAYGVTITMAQTQGATILSGTKPGGNTSIVFWNSQRPADNQAIRTNMIKAFYPAWAVKAFGENTKGSGWGTK